MPKHKKTREQKKKADARLSQLATQPAPTGIPTYTFSSREFIGKKEITSGESHNTLVTVRHDLFKTLWISLAIVALQILFYIFLHNHVLAIPFVSY